MKNQELFDRTVGILVKAYFDNTLQHDCRACAVGNLICSANSINPLSDWDYRWNEVFVTTVLSGQGIHMQCYNGEAKRQIDSTGYSVLELASIELAFETGDKRRTNMFNGLMSVVDCLMQIHEATTEEITQAKSLFKKELAEVG